MFKKLDSFLFHGLHLGIFLFWLYGATVYAPDSPVTPFLWLIAAVLILFGIFEILYRINDRKVSKDIETYYSTNDLAVKRRIQQRYGRAYH